MNTCFLSFNIVHVCILLSIFCLESLNHCIFGWRIMNTFLSICLKQLANSLNGHSLSITEVFPDTWAQPYSLLSRAQTVFFLEWMPQYWCPQTYTVRSVFLSSWLFSLRTSLETNSLKEQRLFHVEGGPISLQRDGLVRMLLLLLFS